jgi:hypothetical protein
LTTGRSTAQTKFSQPNLWSCEVGTSCLKALDSRV